MVTIFSGPSLVFGMHVSYVGNRISVTDCENETKISFISPDIRIPKSAVNYRVYIHRYQHFVNRTPLSTWSDAISKWSSLMPGLQIQWQWRLLLSLAEKERIVGQERDRPPIISYVQNEMCTCSIQGTTARQIGPFNVPNMFQMLTIATPQYPCEICNGDRSDSRHGDGGFVDILTEKDSSASILRSNEAEERGTILMKFLVGGIGILIVYALLKRL
jgi:hypothetical protein